MKVRIAYLYESCSASCTLQHIQMYELTVKISSTYSPTHMPKGNSFFQLIIYKNQFVHGVMLQAGPK